MLKGQTNNKLPLATISNFERTGYLFGSRWKFLNTEFVP